MGIDSINNSRGLFGQQHALQQGNGMKLGLLKHGINNDDDGPNFYKVANKALYRELLSRLNEAVGHTGEQYIEKLEPTDFTPEAVAGRILDVVDGAMKLARLSGGDAAADEKLQQARVGVERGFNEARKMLESMGAFEGLVADNANKTWDLLQAGLDKLGGASASSVVENEVLALQASQHESMALSLTTRDGDKVRLRMASSESALHYRQENGNASVQVHSWQRSEQLYLSVEGELDEEERDAINQLIDESRTLTDKLFSGDSLAAFNHLLEKGQSSTEIASYALQVSKQSRQSLTHAYQAINELDESNRDTSYPKTLVKPIQACMQTIDGCLGRLAANPIIEQPEQALSEGVEKLVRIDEKLRGLANALEQRAGQSLSAFNKNLIDVMSEQGRRFAQKEPEIG